MADSDAAKLALLLQAQNQRQKMLGDSLPQPFDANRPVQEPQQSWLDKLSEAASGVGYGLGDQVQGIGQMVAHPLDTLYSITRGVAKAADNPAAAGRAALEGIKEAAGEAVSSPFNLGRAVGANVNISPSKLAAMLDSPMVREMTVYHGTPHQFPATETNPLGAFDASKIGTGEGAQAYGHGLYFAESPEVAGSYKRLESEHKRMTQGFDPKVEFAYDLLSKGLSEPKVLDNFAYKYGSELSFDDAMNAINEAKNHMNVGSLYHVHIPDEMIDRMLDWDKPLSEQHPHLKDVIEKILTDPRRKKAGFSEDRVDAFGNEMTGGDLYNAASASWFHGPGGAKGASQFFMENNIPGIKYLDAGSRGATGTGTRNFVVFPGEEDKLKILERK